MLITLSGLPGSGTSTVAKEVASVLGLEHVDGGTIFRELAAEAELSLADFAVLAEGDPAIDQALDRRLTERATEGDVVLESRLAGWLTHRAQLTALTVWIHCEDDERDRRVAERDGENADRAKLINREREASEALRYRTFYDIDIADRSIYSLVLDSTRRRVEELVDEVVSRSGALA